MHTLSILDENTCMCTVGDLLAKNGILIKLVYTPQVLGPLDFPIHRCFAIGNCGY